MTMNTYQISNRTSGYILGVYEGSDEAEAIAAMTVDAGYSSVEECADVLGVTSAQYVAGLRAEEVAS